VAKGQAPVAGTHIDERLGSIQWPNKRLLASKHGFCFNELVTSNCPDIGGRGGSTETSVHIYQATRRHIPKNNCTVTDVRKSEPDKYILVT
jgi:hypothetical protein